jgi:cytochrome b subunit of formate dehydrogenase
MAALAGPLTAQPATQPSEPPTSYLSLQTDPENCLSCHRFRGLSRLEPDTGNLRLFFCSAEYYTQRQGPHARLRCTACHEAEEVMVIPHQVQTPVDCTRTCHIVPSSGIEIRFSHQPIQESLERSAHASAALEALEFDPPLLRPGQSTCLYCHDQPAFRTLGDLPRPIGHADVTTRCDMCHGEQMPADVDYYAHHVAGRLQPARPVRQLAQVCAVCHSDPKIIAQMNSHDTVASYLHSFHGKANLLGSRQTATCLDCHASESGDVHAMMAKTDPESSIFEARLPTTCRTTQCHPGAPPGMSRAAVHLDLDPHARTLEFYVAAMFVALTAAVMIVFFILIILDLLNTVIRPPDPHHRKLVRLAKKIQAHPEGRLLLERMSPHQRAQHWILAITFILLVATGMPIKFADAGWASWLITVFGGLPLARWLHRVCGVLLMAAFVYHVGYLAMAFQNRVRQARREGNRTPTWRMILNSPMVINLQDVRQFGQLFAYLLFLRRERPRFGHFNFMQKFEYWAVFWGVPIMGVSGLVLWGAAGVSEYITGRVLNFAFIIHSDEAFLAFIYIAVVHIFSVILAPAIFPVSPGTLTGQVPAEELVEGHLGQVEEVARRLGITVDEPAPRRSWPSEMARQTARRTYALGLMVVCAVIGFTSIRFLYTLLLTRQTAPVEIVEIPKRLDASMLMASALPSTEARSPEEVPPRGPLAHFHRVPGWFQADPGNHCSTAGCHAPLPHAERIEVRAFLNMHATFVDCGVCHAANADKGQAKWFRLPDRQPQGTPAVLELATLLEQADGRERTPPLTTPQLAPLLRAALADSGGDAQLREWLLRLETNYPGSEPWRQLIEEMRRGVRAHVHGEYSAKIGMYLEDHRIGSPTPQQQKATEEYLTAGGSRVDPKMKALLATIHEDVVPAGAMCTPCHTQSPIRIDFAALGYPPGRIQSLKNSAIVRQVLTIEEGKPFHLPRIVEEK